MASGIGAILDSSLNEQLPYSMLSPVVYYILVYHNGPNGIINGFFNDRPSTQLDQEKVTYGFFIQLLLQNWGLSFGVDVQPAKKKINPFASV